LEGTEEGLVMKPHVLNSGAKKEPIVSDSEHTIYVVSMFWESGLEMCV
jgi:hypothetical protein